MFPFSIINNGKVKKLCDAIISNDEKMVKSLLEKGANPNKRPLFGEEFPIHLAAERYNCSIMKMLIDYGANVNKKDRAHRSALNFAVLFRDLEMVKLLLDHGADIFSEDAIGQYPLAWAKGGMCEIVTLEALSRNPSINLQENNEKIIEILELEMAKAKS